MKKFWDLTKLIFILLIFNLMALPAYALNSNDAINKPSSIKQVIYQEVAAENNNNWSAISNSWVEDQKETMLSFIANKENKDNFIGLFNIRSAKISEIKEIPNHSANKFVDVDKYLDEYRDIKVFYVGIDYTVYNESMFYYNGVNYRLAVLVLENGEWKLAEMGDAPVEAIVASKIGFGSPEEKTAKKIHQARHKGLFINPSGKVIKNIAATEAEKSAQRGKISLPKNSLISPLVTGDHVYPSSISIYLTNSVNYSYYGYTQPTARSIDFYYYQKNVLPNEWIASWPADSLEAGAICVKMFGWYHVYTPKFPQYNAALTDRASDSQVFQVNTENSNTTAAIDAMPFGLETWDTYTIFETGYRAGSYDGSGYHSGLAYQNGSHYLADNGYDDYQILHYYYDYSPASGNEMVVLFGY